MDGRTRCGEVRKRLLPRGLRDRGDRRGKHGHRGARPLLGGARATRALALGVDADEAELVTERREGVPGRSPAAAGTRQNYESSAARVGHGQLDMVAAGAGKNKIGDTHPATAAGDVFANRVHGSVLVALSAFRPCALCEFA